MEARSGSGRAATNGASTSSRREIRSRTDRRARKCGARGTNCGHKQARPREEVLKPPGGGSSDIFGASDSPATSPRRAGKQPHNQSSLSSSFFAEGQPPAGANGSLPDLARSKPGNDSHDRLFGPLGAPPPPTPPSKHRLRSSISLAGEPAACPLRTNGCQHNDVVAFRRIKRFRGSSSGLPRNPVTGDGVDVKPHASRRIVRRTRDGNPVTGSGYEAQNGSANGAGSGASSVASEKSSSDSSPSSGGAPRLKNRVPPGGFSSGLW
ncbi:microtubule-associated protein Jupiter isoform X2 [Phymastichus coffea]|uniref:microtubule-associated protein Jupiter isoform X2 n=1 Tax=Phymastichus coffea TaxID=108790 RepID=UPI00273C05E3|nr:microtubule-associated protein Jupiter isoform X2 [Phymastichus coffea]